jgi:integrase
MFAYALSRGVVASNPVDAIKAQHVAKAVARDRALTHNELRVYLQTLYQANMRRVNKLALHLILLTMVRKSELIRARWEGIDFERDEWFIPSESGKTRVAHLVYLSRQARKILGELCAMSIIARNMQTSGEPCCKRGRI